MSLILMCCEAQIPDNFYEVGDLDLEWGQEVWVWVFDAEAKLKPGPFNKLAFVLPSLLVIVNPDVPLALSSIGSIVFSGEIDSNSPEEKSTDKAGKYCFKSDNILAFGCFVAN